MRQDVYRVRPHHEQAAWLERIRHEPDLEPVLLATLLGTSREPRMVYTEPYRLLVRDFVRDTMAMFREKSWPKLRSLVRPRRGAGIEWRRQFKGLDRNP